MKLIHLEVLDTGQALLKRFLRAGLPHRPSSRTYTRLGYTAANRQMGQRLLGPFYT